MVKKTSLGTNRDPNPGKNVKTLGVLTEIKTFSLIFIDTLMKYFNNFYDNYLINAFKYYFLKEFF